MIQQIQVDQDYIVKQLFNKINSLTTEVVMKDALVAKMNDNQKDLEKRLILLQEENEILKQNQKEVIEEVDTE